MTTPENPSMPGTAPDHVIGEMRVQTVREVRYFRVTTRAPFDKLDEVLDPVILRLEAAQAEAHSATAGPVIIRYFEVDEPGIYRMDIGVPVKDDVNAAGDAEIETLPPFHCAALLYWGSLEHIGDAYGALNKAIGDAGLVHKGEGREWYLHFEGDVSPDNVIMLQLEVAAG